VAITVAKIEIFDDAAEKVTNTPEARSYLARVANAALMDAQAAAPIYTGEYERSLFSSALPGNEPAAQLASSSSFWHFVEYGALNTPPYHTMGEAVAGQVDRYEALDKA
jgi:hypothetical protein